MLLDRISDQSTTTGTGDLVLSGAAPAGFKTFFNAFDGNLAFSNEETAPFPCLITNGAEYELSLCYMTQSDMDGASPTTSTLFRPGIVIRSSNAGAPVNFSAGTKTIELVNSAELTTGARIGYGTASPTALLSVDGYGSGSYYYQYELEPAGPGTTNITSIWFATATSYSASCEWVKIWEKGVRFATFIESDPTGGLRILTDTITPSYIPFSATGKINADNYTTPILLPTTGEPGVGTQKLVPYRATLRSSEDGSKSGASNNVFHAMPPGRGRITGEVIVMNEADKTKFRVYSFDYVFICIVTGVGTGTCQLFGGSFTSMHDTDAGACTASLTTSLVSTKNLQFVFGRSSGTAAFCATFELTMFTTAQERVMASNGV